MSNLRVWLVVVALLVMGATVIGLNANGREQLVMSQRAGCGRSARHLVDELNIYYVVYTADVTATQAYRHVEAASILKVSLDIATGVDAGVLAGNPTLEWPAIRSEVAAAGFSCDRAYPAASFL